MYHPQHAGMNGSGAQSVSADTYGEDAELYILQELEDMVEGSLLQQGKVAVVWICSDALAPGIHSDSCFLPVNVNICVACHYKEGWPVLQCFFRHMLPQ